MNYNIAMHIKFISTLVMVINFMASGVVKTDRTKRVYKGKVIEPNSRPWIGLYYGKLTCSAFLVNAKSQLFDDITEGASDIVLTAAHCVVGTKFQSADYNFLHYPNAVVAFGKHNMDIAQEPKQVNITAVRAIIPKSYNQTSHDHDIAILKLERPIEFNQWIKPIALSNVSIDYVQKCSMAGWGGSSVLTEKEFGSVIDEGLQYWIPVNHSDESFPIQGDSGSPMICWYGNSLVAQGLMSSGRRTHPEYKEVWHTSILSHIPWIMDVYDDIKKDFSKDEIRYKVDLSEFSGLVTTSNYSRLTIEYLKYYCEGLGLDATKQLGNKLDLQLNQTEYEEMFFVHGFDSQTTFEEDRFQFYNIIGYVDVGSIYACVSLCHQLNGDQVCNFVAPLKRCYLAHGKFLDQWFMRIHIPKVIKIFPNRKTFRPEKIFMQPQNFLLIAKPSPVGSYKPLSSISVVLPHTGLYCPGRAVQAGHLHLYVEVSTTCLTLIRGKDVQATVFTVVISNGTATEVSRADFGLTTVKGISRSSQTLNSLILPSVQDEDLQLSGPDIRKFDYIDGAFTIKPFTMPFTVRFNKNCVAVLLNESSITVKGRKDRTRFVLAAGHCSRHEPDKWVSEVNIGLHFANEYHDIIVQQNEVFRIHTSGNSPNSMRILELYNDIMFNDHIKPIPLAVDDVILPLKPTFLRASWKSYELLGQPLTIVPLQQETPRLNQTTAFWTADDLVLQRKFNARQRGSYYQDPVGDPLFICGDTVQECKLLGFHKVQETVQDREKDEFFTIHKYKQWMKKAIDISVW